MQIIYTLPGKEIVIDNAVAELVYLVAQGVDRVADELGTTRAGVYKFINAGCINTKSVAERWAKLSDKLKCPIAAAEFIWPELWKGLERHPGLAKSGRIRRRNGTRKRNGDFSAPQSATAPAATLRKAA